MKVHKDYRGELDLTKRIETLESTIQGYDALIDLYKKQLLELRQASSENEKNKNLLQGYKKVIEDLSIKLRKNS